jgi:CO/xanthine dehydrogenase FAD-binding subunit
VILDFDHAQAILDSGSGPRKTRSIAPACRRYWGSEVYARPVSLDDAVSLLAGSGALVIAGGTDVYPAHAGRPVSRPVIDVSAIAALRGISAEREIIRIGGATTWTDIVRAQLPPAFDALKSAAREVGSVQIQNRGTLAGNLCNASPAADGVPPLLALNAKVELRSVRGVRVLPLSEFLTGYRKTAMQRDELLSAVLVPAPGERVRSAFRKLGARRYLVISVVMAAAVIERDEQGFVVNAAAAIGATSPVALRLPELERALIGLAPDIRPSSLVLPRHLAALAPIGDVRASAEYRMQAAGVLIGDVLDLAAGVPAGD